MKTLMKAIDFIEEKVLVISFAVSICIIFLQVIMRYVFNNSLGWSEELARYLFIWQGWLGVSFCERFKQHISIDILKNKLKGNVNKAIEILAMLLAVICAFLLIRYGMDVVNSLTKSHSASTALRIPLWIVYLSLPVGCILYIMRVVLRIYTTLTGKVIDESKAEVSSL